MTSRWWEHHEALQKMYGICRRVLNVTHPEWESIVGLRQEDGTIPSTPYRQWLAVQLDGYEDQVLSSVDPIEIGESIDRFRAWQQQNEQDPCAS